MGNFLEKLKTFKLRRDDASSPPNTDENVSTQLKPSRRWQMMDRTFGWKMSWVLMIVLTAFALMPAQIQAQTPSPTPNSNQEQVPIIMYHLVTENSRYVGKYGIRPSELKSDLQYLKDNGYNTITMADLISFVKTGKALPKNPIILTFDDGNSSDHAFLLPLLQEYDMKAVISILGKTTDEITEKHAKTPNGKYPNLTWGQVIELHNSGIVEIQSHGYNVHGKSGSGKLKRESDDAYHQRLLSDLQKLQDLCEEHLGAKPTTFCYPLGIISKESRAVLEELGFVASLSCQEGMNVITQGDNDCLFKLNRVNRASGRSVENILEKLLRDVEKKK